MSPEPSRIAPPRWNKSLVASGPGPDPTLAFGTDWAGDGPTPRGEPPAGEPGFVSDWEMHAGPAADPRPKPR